MKLTHSRYSFSVPGSAAIHTTYPFVSLCGGSFLCLSLQSASMSEASYQLSWSVFLRQFLDLDRDFPTIEAGFVHLQGRLLRCLSRVVLNDAEASRLALLVKTHGGVKDFAELVEGFTELVTIDSVG